MYFCDFASFTVISIGFGTVPECGILVFHFICALKTSLTTAGGYNYAIWEWYMRTYDLRCIFIFV
jgi:hypothetical protein